MFEASLKNLILINFLSKYYKNLRVIAQLLLLFFFGASNVKMLMKLNY